MVCCWLFACNNNENETGQPSAPEKTFTAGQELFNIHCAQCHRPSEDLVGPALKNVEARWKEKDLLYAFIINSQEVIQKDAYAKELFIKWKQAYMQPFPNLTSDEINMILKYCNVAQ